MELFSCRNCIHNPTQTLTLGPGRGFCLQWGSPIDAPSHTTCRFLHRKDSPQFLVQQALAEHERQYQDVRGMANLDTGEAIPSSPIDVHGMDTAAEPHLRSIAAYWELERSANQTERQLSLLIMAFGNGPVGQEAHILPSLIRRALRRSPSWTTWTARILELLNNIDTDIQISTEELLHQEEASSARWETAFIYLSCIQEFAWLASLPALKYPMNDLGGFVADEDWDGFLAALKRFKSDWIAELLDAHLDASDRPQTFAKAEQRPAQMIHSLAGTLLDRKVHRIKTAPIRTAVLAPTRLRSSSSRTEAKNLLPELATPSTKGRPFLSPQFPFFDTKTQRAQKAAFREVRR